MNTPICAFERAACCVIAPTMTNRPRAMNNNSDLTVPSPSAPEPVLLDVTRLIAHSWSGRQATGIDRVCMAYLRHFRARARAVVQHRGLIRVFSAQETATLFTLLDGPVRGLRTRIAGLLSAAIIGGSAGDALDGMAYLNIGHTDFDLPAHRDWVRRRRIRPFYFLHDLIPILHPEFSRPHAVRRHLGRVRCALRTGAGIILGADAVKRELATFAAAQALPLPPLAVAHIAGEDFRAAGPPPSAAPAPYFLCIGTIEPRKNHRLLFDVWQELANRFGGQAPRLVIVGQAGPMTGDLLTPLVQNPVLRAHVEHRPRCSDGELAYLLHHAQALLVPSLAEGFGLPFVEALEVGTPVIASDLPVFREIGQGAAWLLDPQDRGAWEEAIAVASLRSHRSDDGRSLHAAREVAFAPPRWPCHFEVVERFIDNPMPHTPPFSERVLAA